MVSCLAISFFLSRWPLESASFDSLHSSLACFTKHAYSGFKGFTEVEHQASSIMWKICCKIEELHPLSLRLQNPGWLSLAQLHGWLVFASFTKQLCPRLTEFPLELLMPLNNNYSIILGVNVLLCSWLLGWVMCCFSCHKVGVQYI